jgi:hypothetical protein
VDDAERVVVVQVGDAYAAALVCTCNAECAYHAFKTLAKQAVISPVDYAEWVVIVQVGNATRTVQRQLHGAPQAGELLGPAARQQENEWQRE